jgi:hypothetical protein
MRHVLSGGLWPYPSSKYFFAFKSVLSAIIAVQFSFLVLKTITYGGNTITIARILH